MQMRSRQLLNYVAASIFIGAWAYCETPPPQYDQKFTPEVMLLKESDPRLFALNEETTNEHDAIYLGDFTVPDAVRRQAMAAWHKSPRPPDEEAYIVTTLFDAYAQDPPNWPVVQVALSVAWKGVQDVRVETLARGLIESAADLPDEAMNSVAPAIGYLALSGNDRNIELVKKATSRAFVGVDAEPDAGYVGGPRESLCQCALVALFMYPPLDQAIDALRDVSKSHVDTKSGFNRSIRENAGDLLDQLKRVQKGERVPMPRP
ncbi:MAG: hypothetical protein AMXMBFR82_18450 [Candidatus Hydrogenedentota bacterium]